MDSRREPADWQRGDSIDHERLNLMQDLAKSAQALAGGSGLTQYGSALGGSAFLVNDQSVRPFKPARVKITGSASGGGKYTGTLWQPPTVDIPATGNASEAEIGVEGDTPVTVRVINVREIGKSTHDLAASGFLPLIFPAQFLKVAADGVPVYVIDGIQQKDCT